MSRAALAFAFLLLTIAARAQFVPLYTDSVVDLPGRWNHRIRVEGALDFNTSAVRNELPWALYRGGHVERELRERSADQLRADNTAGFVLGARIGWTGRDCFLGKRHWRPVVSIAQQEIMGLRFTEDLFRLTFFGNAAYADRTADLSPSAFQRMSFRSAGVGVTDDRTGSFLRLDLVQGGSFTEVDVSAADLYTAPDGRLLSTSLNGHFHASDTAGNGYERYNGLGASLSGRWSIALANGKFQVAVGADDLGFVRWNGHSVHLEKDTLIDYRGVDVTDLLDIDGALIGEEQLRDTFGLHFTAGAHNTLLPFRAALDVVMRVDDRTRAGIVVAQRNLTGHIPEVTLHADRRLGTGTLLGAGLTYGGAGGIRVGASARMRLCRWLWADLAIPHLPGLLLAGARSTGARLGLAVGF